MNKLIKIGNQEISTKEYKNQRVVTFREIDLVHERVDGTAKRNFNSNKERFLEGEDYFFVKPSEIETYEIRTSEINNAGTYLITEQGYLMLVKSFTDDLAWQVQRQLVNTYFKQTKVLSQIEILQQSVEVLNRHEKELKQMDNRMDKLEYEIPLYGAESEELSNHVKRKGIERLGGKKSGAYNDKEIRPKVYRDIYSQIKREFGLYHPDGRAMSYKALKRKYLADAHELVDCYELPAFLYEMIQEINVIEVMEKRVG